MDELKLKTDYSKSLNVPKADVKNVTGLDTNPTGIPQRAGLPIRELDLLEFWKLNKIYEKSLEPLSEKGTFILHDGPPFSNGNIHIGHSFNKVLKDVIMRHRSMQGYRAPYTPGWDNNGLPIELLVSKEFRQKGYKPDHMELRARCRAVAEEWTAIQSEQFQRLGIRGDWANPYLTMLPQVSAKQLDVFAQMVEAEYVYRGLRPVYWSLVDETALADHEVEYADKVDPSIYVAFRVQSDVDAVFGTDIAQDRCYTVIWTTTPWTIPANVAVAVGPEIDYVVAEHDGRRYLVAKSRIEVLALASGWSEYTIFSDVNARDIENLIFQHPLYNRASPLVIADYVTTSDGTGVVHTAPGHGKEDFATGQKYNLPVLQILTGNGFFNDDAGPELRGIKKDAGQEMVLQMLADSGMLLAREDITHSYPHGWRSHDPLVFRATEQWFVDIDNNGHRDKCLRAIDDVSWYPNDSVNRIRAMVSGRPDWCISRQRFWGLGIPVFYAQPSGTPLYTPESIRYVRDIVAIEGSDAWFIRPASDFLPEGFSHPETGETEFTKETDIFDVWFDSGSTCRTVLEQWPGLSYPADVYLEGGDQHRGWFNSSLMIGIATKGEAPFRQVITNGWTLDEKGRAMHKSLGNVLAPQTVIDKYGADVLRLWVCSTDYFADVKVGDKIIEQVAINYRTLRNSLRFAVGNLYAVEPRDFEVESHAVAYKSLTELHRWVLHRLNDLVHSVSRSYEIYEFHKGMQAILSFCSSDLSSFYFDVLKDTLYSYPANSHERRSAQTVLHEVVSIVTRLMAPVLAFTAEEVWQKLQMEDKPLSVHLASWPQYSPVHVDAELDTRWSALRSIRDDVNKTLEGTKKRLELAVTLSCTGATYSLLNAYLKELPSLFLVSEVTLIDSSAPGVVVTSNGPASGVRCSRCWVSVSDGGDDPASSCARGCVREYVVDAHAGCRRRLPVR